MYPKSVLANKNRKRTVRRRDFYSPESKMFGSGNQRKSYPTIPSALFWVVGCVTRIGGPWQTVKLTVNYIIQSITTHVVQGYCRFPDRQFPDRNCNLTSIRPAIVKLPNNAFRKGNVALYMAFILVEKSGKSYFIYMYKSL